jgi:hypothetical protein
MNSEYMKTLKSFKTFMTSDAVPNYVFRYCSKLGKGQWEWFYDQMIIALELTDEPDYLFYVLKWILKFDYDDIAYEMYCHDMMDPECRNETLIKLARRAEYDRKYWKKFTDDYGPPTTLGVTI